MLQNRAGRYKENKQPKEFLKAHCRYWRSAHKATHTSVMHHKKKGYVYLHKILHWKILQPDFKECDFAE